MDRRSREYSMSLPKVWDTKWWYRRLEWECKINGRKFIFILSNDTVGIAPRDYEIVDDPAFQIAFQEARNAREKAFSQSYDEDGEFDAWRNSESDRLQKVVAKDIEIPLSEIPTSGQSQEDLEKSAELKIRLLYEHRFSELETLHNRMQQERDERLKELKSIQDQIEQTRKNRQIIFDDRERSLARERRELEEEKRLWMRLQVIVASGDAPDPGCVYLIDGKNGQFKLGKSTKLDGRIGAIKTSNPNVDGYTAIIATGHMSELESNLKKQFASKNIRGEWYALSEDDVSFIRSLA